MATYYVDNVGGSDSNSGLSEALAFATITKLKSVAALTGADIIRIKYTGTDYTVAQPATSGAAFSTDGGTTVVSGLMVTGYTSNTQNPTIIYQHSGSATYTTWNARKNININLTFDYGSSTSYMWTPTSNVVSFKSCNILYTATTAAALNNAFVGLVELANCTINYNSKLVSFNATTIGKKLINCRVININPSGLSTVTGMLGVSSGQSYNKTIFHFITAATTNFGIFYVVSASSSTGYMTNCTVVIDNASTGTANIALCQLQNTHVSNINAFNETMINNVFIDMRTTQASCVLRTSAAVSAGDAYKIGVNNNAYFTSNKFISLTDSSTGVEAFSNFALTGSPFLSVDPTNANFCVPDTSNADGLLLASSNAIDSNTAVGAIDGAYGGGAVPNAYDLRAGVTVGAVTGTLVVPAISDVKVGVNYDAAPNAKTGTYDGSDRWTDPGEANVLLGTAYKANSTTNNKTGTLESTDPGVANVVSGTAYKINSVLKTGTRTSIYALLSLSDVKIGVDRGDGQVGTYVAAERYSDPLESNVLSGVTYTYNAVLKTGSAASYPLLIASNVKIGVDRGDGVTGTYDGSDRYTDLDLAQVNVGYNFRYNSLTNNRTGTFDHTTLYTDPGESSVYQYVQYKFNSVTFNKTGNLVVPSALDTKIGVPLGSNGLLTGEYDGSDRWTDPGVANVLKDVAYKAGSLTNNRLGTLESTDPGEANVVAGTAYKINSVSKLGTRSAIYDLLALNLVKIGTDRGDGQVGTYDASERYTDINLANVLTGYTFKYNSLIDNRTGTRTAIYPLLPANNVESGIDRGDGSFGTNKGENFNSSLVAAQIKIGEVITNLGNSITGDYVATERYTDLPENEVKLGTNYIYNNIAKTGTLAGGAADYPIESKVLYPTVYAFGTKTGTLGQYNNIDLDIVSQMQSNAKSIMANVLTTEFSELRYLKEVEKNDFYNNTKQFGIRALENEQTKELIGKDTIEQVYEIVLTTDFQNRDGDDFERAAELYLLQKWEEIRRQLRISKFGFSQQVRILKDVNAAECQKVGDNVIVLKGKVKVSYSVN